MAHVGPMLIVGLVLDTPSSTGYQTINLREGSPAAQRAERQCRKCWSPARACRPTTRVGSWLRHVVRRAPVSRSGLKARSIFVLGLRHRRVPRLRYPLPGTSSILFYYGASLSVVHQPVQYSRDRSERIFMPQQNRRDLLLYVLANLTGAERPSRFHQHHAAGFSEAGLAAITLAVYQFQQFLVEHLVSKHVGQANDSLFDGADAFHDFGALLEQTPQLVVRGLEYLLNVRICTARATPSSASSIGSGLTHIHGHPPVEQP